MIAPNYFNQTIHLPYKLNINSLLLKKITKIPSKIMFKIKEFFNYILREKHWLLVIIYLAFHERLKIVDPIV